MEQQATEQQITLQNISILQNNILANTVDKMAADMKFYAVFYVIVGAFYCLSIFGAIFGIPLIIYSLKLKNSGDQFREFAKSKDFFMLHKAMENQRKFFFFNKVIIIIGIIIFLLYILLIIWFGSSMFFNMPDANFA